jgi:hypothetical protein
VRVGERGQGAAQTRGAVQNIVVRGLGRGLEADQKGLTLLTENVAGKGNKTLVARRVTLEQTLFFAGREVEGVQERTVAFGGRARPAR